MLTAFLSKISTFTNMVDFRCSALLVAMLYAVLLFSCTTDNDLGSLNFTGDTFEDSRDGKSYKWVKIGTQTWMAENLNYNATDSKCYDNKENNCDIYGRLYSWATAMALPLSCNNSVCSSFISEKHKGACPISWHIPTNAEWDELHSYVGGINGTTAYKFAALTGGAGLINGSFDGAGNAGQWWSTSEYNAEAAYGQATYYDGSTWYSNYKSILFSVRCVKDNAN